MWWSSFGRVLITTRILQKKKKTAFAREAINNIKTVLYPLTISPLVGVIDFTS